MNRKRNLKLERVLGRVLVYIITIAMLCGMIYPISKMTMDAYASEETTESVTVSGGDMAGSVSSGDGISNLNQTVSDSDAWTESDEVSAVDALYERLMSCRTYDELSEMMDAMTEEEYVLMAEFSDAQSVALAELVDELSSYDTEVLPGGPGGGGQELDASYYNKDALVFWDTMNSSEKGSYQSSKDDRIASVTLNGSEVVWADSDETGDSTGKKLNTYYQGASAGSMTTADLVIVPADGYYVTKIVIACTSGRRKSDPYNCNTWGEGNAYEADFDVSTAGTITVEDLSSLNFSHRSEGHNYFILIKLAPIPSPLYVEYDYGLIGTYLGDHFSSSAFANADGWTDEDGSNVFGTGEVQTNDTQFKYSYAEGLDDKDAAAAAAAWKHYANTITDQAKTEAANVGYYFAGWKAEYYDDATVTANGSGAYNNYTYTMTNEYGEGNYDENDEVNLVTHVRLIAQWKPLQLTVTKTVDGLTDGFLTDHTYKIRVQKQRGNEWTDYKELTFTVNGNSSVSQVISPVTPGNYRVVETEGNVDLSNDSTVMYITVSDGDECNLSVDGIVNGSVTSGALTVVNCYSATPAKKTLTVTKKVSGNMGDTGKEFSFTIKYGDQTETFTLSHDESQSFEIPYNAEVTITEQTPDDYGFSVEAVKAGETDFDEYSLMASGLAFTMPSEDVSVTVNNHKDVTIDTGIMLDSLPYILIIGIVIAGGVIWFIQKRRVRDED